MKPDWIDNADSYLCPVCGYETNNPNYHRGICPKCGFVGGNQMANFGNIEIVVNLRPCLVSGEKALFHRWVDQAYIVHPSPLKGGHPGGQVWNVYGLVELENGQVMEVPACNIQFVDDPCKELAWPISPMANSR